MGTLIDNAQLSRADFAYFAAFVQVMFVVTAKLVLLWSIIAPTSSPGHPCGYQLLHSPKLKDYAFHQECIRYGLWQLLRADFSYSASIRSSYVCYCCKDSFIREHYCPNRFSKQFGFHQDIPTDINFSILSSSRLVLRLHQARIRCGTNSQVLSPGQCLSLERKFTQCF